MMVCSSESCSVNLYPTPWRRWRATRSGPTSPVGDGANEMSALPKETFQPSDIKLHTGDGKTLGVGAKIRVTGQLHSDSTTSCAINNVDLIEAAN